MADQFDLDTYLQAQQAGPSPAAVPAKTTPASGEAKSFDLDKYLETKDAPLDDGPTSAKNQDMSSTRLPKMAGHALATGTQDILGMPGAAGEAANELLPKKLPPNLAVARSILGFMPTGREISKFTGLGLENHPELTPQNWKEKGLVAGVEALPTAGAMMLGGVPAGGALATSIVGNESAAIAHSLQPKNPILPVVAGIIGSMGVNGGFGWLEKSTSALNAAAKLAEAKATLSRAKAGGISVSMVKGAAKDAMEATKTLGQHAITSATEHVNNTFTGIANMLGSATNWEKAGKTLQKTALDWRTNTMPKMLGDAATELEKKLPAETPTSLDDFEGVLNSLGSRAGSLQGAADLLIPKLPAMIAKKLESRTELAKMQAGKAAETAALAAGKPKDAVTLAANEAEKLAEAPPPTVGEVRALRSLVGEAFSNPQLVKDIGQKQLEAMYSALTKGLGKTAKDLGAEAEWENYNKTSTELYNFASGPLSRVISQTGRGVEKLKPGEVARKLLKDGQVDSTDLVELRKFLPEEGPNALASLQLRDVEGYKALSDESRAALVHDPVHRSQLDSAIDTHATTKLHAGREFEKAQAEHNRVVNAAQAGKVQNQADVTQAKMALEDAKEALQPLPGLHEVMKHGISSLRSGWIANELTPWISAHFGIPANPFSDAAITALGMTVPAMYRGAKEAFRNPRNLLAPAAGGVAGANALAPGRNALEDKQAKR